MSHREIPIEVTGWLTSRLPGWSSQSESASVGSAQTARTMTVTEYWAGTMSHKNVKLVRKALDAYTRRDLDALRKVADPDLELDWSASRAWLAGVYRGLDEALRFYEGYFEAFDEIVIEPDRFIEVGDSVVVPNVAHQRGRHGNEVSARSTLVFTVRNGKLLRICLYQETEQALEAVGLAEPADSN